MWLLSKSRVSNIMQFLEMYLYSILQRKPNILDKNYAQTPYHNYTFCEEILSYHHFYICNQKSIKIIKINYY